MKNYFKFKRIPAINLEVTPNPFDKDTVWLGFEVEGEDDLKNIIETIEPVDYINYYGVNNILNKMDINDIKNYLKNK